MRERELITAVYLVHALERDCFAIDECRHNVKELRVVNRELFVLIEENLGAHVLREQCNYFRALVAHLRYHLVRDHNMRDTGEEVLASFDVFEFATYYLMVFLAHFAGLAKGSWVSLAVYKVFMHELCLHELVEVGFFVLEHKRQMFE